MGIKCVICVSYYGANMAKLHDTKIGKLKWDKSRRTRTGKVPQFQSVNDPEVGGLIQKRLSAFVHPDKNLHPQPFGLQTDARDMPDDDIAVFDQALSGDQAVVAGKIDRDLRPKLTVMLIDKPAGDQQGRQRHDP